MTGITHTHKLVVTLFLLIYLIKLVLLLTNKKDALANFTKRFKVPEMIISFLFLATGGYMLYSGVAYTNLFAFKLAAVFASIPLAIIGFKKQNKALAVLSVLLIFGAYGMAEVHKKKVARGEVSSAIEEASSETVSAELEVGYRVYKQRCNVCHGKDGAKQLSGAANLQESELNQEDIIHIINNGKGRMASYGNLLTKDEINEVAKYVQSLRK
ncbi:cbb3-type cytochrome c oxidase subunit III [Sediminitomix flava]|uniref:Cbb3-type cytochrome c oxidase subunit III n=2 Tax=Sediminitomix flava TaxID=379075 RepID=A0A315Z841_SEDFL|nr:cbb3-type cytochrome c oxidase subunit III [Sediminitomix flava]